MAIDEPGDENIPPAQSFFSFVPQNKAFIWPLGPLDPTAVTAPEVGL
jgi:hypothetical protein